MKRLFHGWTMVGAGSLMQFVQGTLLLQSFGAYFAVLRDDRGWSKTELSGAAAMHQLEAALLGPVLGGLLAGADSWRWVFFINAPVGMVALIFCAWGVRESRDDSVTRQVDWLGDTLGLPYRAYQANVRLRHGGHYGNAILSRFPLHDHF